MKILLDECLPLDFRDLLPFAPAILQALESIEHGQTVAIPFSDRPISD